MTGPQTYQSWLKNPVSKCLEIIIIIGFGWTLILVVNPNNWESLSKKQIFLWAFNIFMMALIGLQARARNETFKDWGLVGVTQRWYQTLGYSIVVGALALVGFGVGSFIGGWIFGIPESAVMDQYDYFQRKPVLFILTLLGVFVGSSFGEELIYRAFIIKRLDFLNDRPRTYTIISVLISAFFFSLIHYNWGPVGVFQSFGMGLVLAIAYHYFSKNLWILVLAHAYLDLILLIQIFWNQQ